ALRAAALGGSAGRRPAAEAQRRLALHGPNVVASENGHPRLRLFMRAVVNPLVLLLAVLATISVITGDLRAAIVMVAMIVLGVALRFAQESRAQSAAAQLRAMIRVTATVVRDGQAREEPLADLVPGDIVHLSAGDMVPADGRGLSCRGFFVT